MAEENITEQTEAQATDAGQQPLQGNSMPDSDKETRPDISMLMDVHMNLSLEVGRTRLKLRDVLNLSKGTVVELDKLAGESLDIMANGKRIAQGDVVSVNGKYGVRITSVSSTNDALTSPMA